MNNVTNHVIFISRWHGEGVVAASLVGGIGGGQFFDGEPGKVASISCLFCSYYYYQPCLFSFLTQNIV